ncbi:Riboflavin kinase / FMN adenylyltransferase [Leucobacter sp. 7(1)]|uniref:bifunctional riboflavin kinase/FAD synthetase n=1 Tax=Leucobacter sp. 7(1) TaxID=1255613 RepID=UPI00097EFC44|nr:bifunctional riboflavin kinase/FAD synthetase [Leucobacter sp. 7(1)]SJN12949.1 Riboflavin kinase / FMN adenylyltransferase [Leucobacter sp. 7(1)]
MRVIQTLAEIVPADFEVGSCVAIGKFDGLHLGHQSILRRLVADARADRQLAVVFTFANNPLSFLNPERCPQPLMSRAQRLEAFAAAGVDVCVMVEFDADFAAIPAPEFVTEVLVDQLHARHVIMGSDFRFGHRGAGDGALLRELGDTHGFTAESVAWVEDPLVGSMSSSRTRDAVLAGDVETASRMLGRPPAVRAEVVHGDARGRELGFPTANLGGTVEGLVPADGVYAGWVLLGAERERRIAAISVGNNPTFTPNEQSRVEAFVLDFEGDLYGQPIEVQFAHRLRGTVRFESLDDLLVQMHADVVETRRLLES